MDMDEKVIIQPCLLQGDSDLSEETPLYKYFSVEGFLYLIEFKRLIFSRITTWPDAYEGSRFELFKKQPDFSKSSKDDFYGSCWSLQSEDERLYDDNDDMKKENYEAAKSWSKTMKATKIIDTIFMKRISFRYESEYRYICVLNESKEDKIISVEFDDLFDLIDEILVAPTTPLNKWISRTLYNISKSTGTRFSIDSVKWRFCRYSKLSTQMIQHDSF